jgi:hypothetical protein
MEVTMATVAPVAQVEPVEAQAPPIHQLQAAPLAQVD